MKLQERRWEANPQAMAAIRKRDGFNGHPDLGVNVDRDTWLTPRYVLDQLGPFDLDPCAAGVSPEWVARKYWLKVDNGLERKWEGRVFMNPPFSNTAQWLARHAGHGAGISLVPATLESVVWRKYVWPSAKAILVVHGRMRFCNPDGSATTGRPLRGIALIAWTPSDAEVLERSTLAGYLLRAWAIR